MSATLTTAATHIPTAAKTIAGPGWARMPAQLTCLTAGHNLVNHSDSARRTARQR